MNGPPYAPIVGYHFDGSPLRIGDAIHVANPTDKGYARYRFLFQFGAVGPTYVLVWADDAYDGLEIAAEYLLDREWWGCITPHGGDLGCDCSDPFDCGSHTYTESGWITSHEWHVDEPTNEELRRIHYGTHYAGPGQRPERTDFRSLVR